MVPLLIEILVVLLVMAILAWAALQIIAKFALPEPTKWVVGAILLIVLLVYASHAVGGGPPLFIR